MKKNNSPEINNISGGAELPSRKKGFFASDKWKRFNRVLDRIFGFMLAFVLVVGCTCLGVEYILVKGPSEALKNTFVCTLHETSHWKWIPNIFLSQAEIDEITVSYDTLGEAVPLDASLISIPTEGTELVDEDGRDAYGLLDEDGDGIILVDVKGSGFVGYMLVVLDPSRVSAFLTPGYPVWGTTLDVYCEKYEAVGGINAGGYFDPNGAGTGGLPQGLTIIEGEAINQDSTDSFIGLSEDNHLFVGYYNIADLQTTKIRTGVSFGPPLVVNGEITDAAYWHKGVAPRTAIGQREDGAILMLVIDGRQAHSIGATFLQVAETMLQYGAVNVGNLDGGSSSTMYYEGGFVNSCSSMTGTSRLLATAFLIH